MVASYVKERFAMDRWDEGCQSEAVRFKLRREWEDEIDVISIEIYCYRVKWELKREFRDIYRRAVSRL